MSEKAEVRTYTVGIRPDGSIGLIPDSIAKTNVETFFGFSTAGATEHVTASCGAVSRYDDDSQPLIVEARE